MEPKSFSDEEIIDFVRINTNIKIFISIFLFMIYSYIHILHQRI